MKSKPAIAKNSSAAQPELPFINVMSPYRGSFLAEAKSHKALVEHLSSCLHHAGPVLVPFIVETASEGIREDRVRLGLLAEAVLWANRNQRRFDGVPLTIEEEVQLQQVARIALA